MDFKELFKLAVSAGVGLPVDKSGNTVGTWTPKSLAEALSEVDPSGRGVDIRSIQLWFQDNRKGISPENMKMLAQLFGCDKPDLATQWRVELNAANMRLAAKRKEEFGNKVPTPFHEKSSSQPDNTALTKPHSLAQRTELILSNNNSMALPLVVFTGACALGLIAFTLNIHSVIYADEDAAAKQVGFLWAPNWTIVFLILLPLFLALTIDLLRMWKENWRRELVELGASTVSWNFRLKSASHTFWATLFITVVVASGYNWMATHLIPLVNGDVGTWSMDWGRIAIVHPEVISIPAAVGFTGLAFLHNGFAAYYFFASHILLHLMKLDFVGLARSFQNSADEISARKVRSIGVKLVYGTYRCTAVGLLITIMMKAQSSYLQSEASNILLWLADDIRDLFGNKNVRPAKSSMVPGAYYSFFCLLPILGTFATASLKIRLATSDQGVPKTPTAERLSPWIKMDINVAMLVVSFIMIGTVPGFTLFLILTMTVTLLLFAKPSLVLIQDS